MRSVVAILAASAILVACAPHVDGGKQMPLDDPIPAGSVVGFYGDSLTFGLGASAPGKRWSTLLCERRGWTEVNPSVSGLGFVQARAGVDLPQQLVDAQPDLVVVALGHNDLLLVDQRGPEVQAAITDDFRRLRAGLPDARIVVLALFSPLTFEPPEVRTVDSWLAQSAEEVDAVFLPKSGGWLVGHPNWTVDGIHFNDAGNAAIADLLDDELSRVL